MTITTHNPATGADLKEYTHMPWGELEERLGQAGRAQAAWAQKPLSDRVGKVRALAQALKDNRERYALQITLEMGKPAKEARAEVDKCALLCEVYAQRSQEWMKDEMVPLDGLWHKIRLEPLGVVLSIMPWNYPFWQALRFAIPTLIMGNGCLLRHASNVTGCSLLIEESFKRAAFPEHLFQSLLCSHQDVERLIAHNAIAGVSFTGSTEVGSSVARSAGAHLKKAVLELGGSDPFIVLEDADLGRAAEAAATSRLMNAGQSCISAKRFLVHEKVLNEFNQLFVEALKKRKTGDPQDLITDLGPLVSEKAAQELEAWAQEAQKAGAKTLLQGKREGAFMTPYAFTDVPKTTPLGCQEVFGPIAVISSFKDDAEAIRIANATEFGLSSSVWSKDISRAENLARALESGCVFINTYSKSDPRMPFGGVKKSGMGRELGRYGLLEFANVKTYSAYF